MQTLDLMGKSLTVCGDVDPKAVEQLVNCMEYSVAGALNADGHVGYSQPVGGVVAYPEHISPSGVGYDIGCGNKAVKTDLHYGDIDHLYAVRDDEGVQPEIARIMDEINERISFGVGRKNNEPVDHPVFDSIAHADFVPQRGLLELARRQLGTVGAGNHYVDLFRDEDGWVWVGVHFGSRGFGHKTASGFLAMNRGLKFGEHAPEGEMFSPPVLFDINSELGQSYIHAMRLAGEYAYAGRDVVVNKVLDILGASATYEVHNHHNYAWRERVKGAWCWVVRKGCTPAFNGQEGFVGATMGEPSVILEGTGSRDSELLLNSTVHGAGRVMSRTQAAGKVRRRWCCNNRDCGWHQGHGEHKPEDGRCPQCGFPRLSKRDVKLTEGKVDWDAALRTLHTLRVELRGGAADEAPEAYKRLDAVLGYHSTTIRIKHELTPIGVCMAGPDTFDPFKD